MCRRTLFFMILLYRRLLERTGDIVNQRRSLLLRIIGEHEMTFSRRSLCFIILSSTNCWRIRCIDQQQQSVASAIFATIQQNVRNTTALVVTPTFKSASTFVGINIHGISVGYLLCGPERWIVDREPIYIRNDSLERR